MIPTIHESLSARLTGGRELPEDFDQAVDAMGWRYEVEKIPAFHQTGRVETMAGDRPTFEKADGFFLLRRRDTQLVTGQVRKIYQITQNSVPLAQVRPLVEDGLARLKSGGTWNGGAVAWMMLVFDAERILQQVRERHRQSMLIEAVERLFAEERVAPWGFVRMDHSGSGSNMVLQLPFRLACLNQLPAIIKYGRHGRGVVTIRHSASGAEKLREEAARIFGNMAEHYVAYALDQDRLRRTHISRPTFSRLVLDPVAPIPDTPAEPTTRQENARIRVLERRQLVTRLWVEGHGHVGDESAWEALNGLSEAMDHHPTVFRARGGQAGELRSRIDGSLMRAKRQVQSRLIRYATSQKFRTEIDEQVQSAAVRAPSLN